jgi:hypothetical protein
MGKTVDLGALLLQNEQVRAVGNMGVNAAGDLIDESNRVIDQRNRQVQRQYKRQTNVSNTPVVSSNLAARKMQADSAKKNQTKPKESKKSTVIDDALIDPVTPPAVAPESVRTGGLAAAIARSKEIKQELEKTLQQQKAEQGLKKI